MKKVIPFLFLHLTCCLLSAQQTASISLDSSTLYVHKPVVIGSDQKRVISSSAPLIKKINDNLYHIAIDINPSSGAVASDVQIPIVISFQNATDLSRSKNAFHWVPNIKSQPEQIIPQHVFRSPAMIFTLKSCAVTIIPDIRQMEAHPVAPYYLDLKYSATDIHVVYGLSHYSVVRHQYYERKPAAFPLQERLRLAFYVLVTPGTEALDVLKNTNAFLWSNFAAPYRKSILPQTVPFQRYAAVAYPMALDNYWVDGPVKEQGGITLSTFYDSATKRYGGRSGPNDLWYHSWFNNARTAYGLYAWGKRLNKPDWRMKGKAAVNLLIGAPRNAGWFPTIYSDSQKKWIESGQGGGKGMYHVPDNVWSAFWVLRFHQDMDTVAGADELVVGLAEALLKVQNEDGSFPARILASQLTADSIMRSSSSGAMATWYLLELLLRKKVPPESVGRYEKAIKSSLVFLKNAVLPLQRFEDFELYFSCSRKPIGFFDSTTHLYAQNTLAIQWCAEAMLKAYQLFGEKEYLSQGEYCLNILSLYQQVWNPYFINLYAFGGFGVMNTDAEWNDARQAQFAETYMNFYHTTGNREYLERGIYACRASFALMVLPENKEVCPENYQGIAINGESLPGNMAENYGHSGFNERAYQSGFHWGSGSALTTAAIMTEQLGEQLSSVVNSGN